MIRPTGRGGDMGIGNMKGFDGRVATDKTQVAWHKTNVAWLGLPARVRGGEIAKSKGKTDSGWKLEMEQA